MSFTIEQFKKNAINPGLPLNNLLGKLIKNVKTDVFETFTKESKNLFELDCAPYVSTPGYSWDAMLRFTGVNLKLISDIKMYQFIETIKGGISMICKGYAKANNELLKSYDPCKPKT